MEARHRAETKPTSRRLLRKEDKHGHKHEDSKSDTVQRAKAGNRKAVRG